MTLFRCPSPRDGERDIEHTYSLRHDDGLCEYAGWQGSYVHAHQHNLTGGHMCAKWNDPNDICRCRLAVLRAYTGLTADGVPEAIARDAAARVLFWHHPEIGADERERLVGRWLDHRGMH